MEQRLRVLPRIAAGRRVARVADRILALETGERALVEDLRHEPEIANGGEAPVFGDRDPRRLLAAVLQRVETEVRQARDVASRRTNTEHAAHQVTVPSSTTSSQRNLGRGVDRDDDAFALDDVDIGRPARPGLRLAERKRDTAVRDVVREREQCGMPPNEVDEPVAVSA